MARTSAGANWPGLSHLTYPRVVPRVTLGVTTDHSPTLLDAERTKLLAYHLSNHWLHLGFCLGTHCLLSSTLKNVLGMPLALP